jgi:NH3-dependent NAD+ synthetase
VESAIPGLRKALVLALSDYAAKCGFKSAVLGLSGGIDSAVTAALAVEALGPERVLGVAMPGPYSSEGSLHDARALAERLGIPCAVIPIGLPLDAYRATLGPLVGMTPWPPRRTPGVSASDPDGPVQLVRAPLDGQQVRDRGQPYALRRHGRG